MSDNLSPKTRHKLDHDRLKILAKVVSELALCPHHCVGCDHAHDHDIRPSEAAVQAHETH
jgi:hypothetical protein